MRKRFWNQKIAAAVAVALLPAVVFLGMGAVNVQPGGSGGGGGGGSTNAAWGDITGTLANQSDLATALTNKLEKAGDTMTGALAFSGTNHAGMKLNSLTTTAKNALTPAAGMMLFDSTLGRFQSYDGAAWYSHVRTSGDTMTGVLALPAGSTIAPSLSFRGEAGTGFYSGSSQQVSFVAGSDESVRFLGGGKINLLPASATIFFNSDTILTRDAANTLALRNGANAQAFNIYNTYTDASNWERVRFAWSGNFGYLQTQSSGTGQARGLVLSSAEQLYLQAGGATTRWQVNTSGHFVAGIDNTYDIGANGANRPRNIYAGTSIHAGSGGFVADGLGFQSLAGGFFYWDTRSVLASPADGRIKLSNNAGTDFDLFQFGGTTASFPALKRSSAGLDVRLADDSNYGTLGAPNNQAGYTHVCTSATSNAVFYVSVPSTNTVSGEVQWTVTATDGTDTQAQSGRTTFDAIAKSTAVTATTTSFTNSAAASAGTLTVLVTANTATNNVVALMVTPTTSLTTTNLVTKWRITTPLTYTVNTL